VGIIVKPAAIRILELLAEEAPLSATQISERLQIPYTTIKSLLSVARLLGAVEYYRGIRGAYILTDHGKKLVEQNRG